MKHTDPLAHSYEVLQQPNGRLTHSVLQPLSDLYGAELEKFASIWEPLPSERKKHIAEAVLDCWRDYIDVSFDGIARFWLTDPNANVRISAIYLLGERENELALMCQFLQILKTDESAEVRQALVVVLLNYMYTWSIEEMPEAEGNLLEDTLRNSYQNDPSSMVRNAALRALGYSTRPDIRKLLEKAYRSDSAETRASALFAMGYQALPDVWSKTALQAIQNSKYPVETEAAAFACGELGVAEAVPFIADYLQEAQRAHMPTLIRALGEIGSKQAKSALVEFQSVYEEDEEIQEWVTEALADIELQNGLINFGFMDMDDILNGDVYELEEDDLDEE